MNEVDLLADEAEVEAIYRLAIQEYLREVTNEVFPSLVAAGPQSNPGGFNGPKWMRIFENRVVPALAKTWATSARRVGEALGAKVSLGPEPFLEWLAAHRLIAESVPGRFAEKMTKQLDLDIGGVLEAAKSIAQDFGRRANSLHNHAAETVARHADDGEFTMIWIATLDARTRPTHAAADGQRAPLGGTFTVGGEQLRYPGDIFGSASETANCRCRLIVTPAGVTAAGGFTAPSEQEMDMPETDTVVLAEDEATGETFRTFTDAVIAIVGSPTSDGRMLAADIDFTMRDFPLPLMWMKQNSGGHMDAYTVGVLESATFSDKVVTANGYLLNSAEADECAGQLAHGVSGPSVDLASVEWIVTDKDGNEFDDEDAYWDALDGDGVVMTMTKAELIGTTLCATPAFGATKLELNTERESRDVALVASAAATFQPKTYDHRLFEDPKLPGPTLPTLGDDGRVFGHLACFGACHRSIQTECVMAPRSPSNYSHFLTSPAVRLDDGNRLPVGRLTVGTGHAPAGLRGGPALAHYDNTGTCFALVNVGEDEHGIWFSGITAPWATPEQIEMGLASPLSGDWRDFGQGLDLIAALAVNTPGFSARGRDDASGRPVALVASLGPSPLSSGGIEHLTINDIKAAVAEAIVETQRTTAFVAERDAILAAAAEVTTPPEPNDEIAELLAAADL